MNFDRKIIAIRGDTQGGHSGGLVNPETLIPDMEITEEGDLVIGWRNPELRPVQKRLWVWHCQDLDNIQKLADGDPIVWIEMGDLTQGAVFKDDLAETALSSQYFISKWNTKPLLQLPNVRSMYIVRGTGVHVWGEGSTETMLTHTLHEMFPWLTVKITTHWLLAFDGFLLDVAHHGPGPGIRNWTRGNVFELYCKSLMKDDIELGNPTPDVILRGHKHEFIYRPVVNQVKNRIWKADGFITPPYCFIGDHAQKATNSPSFMGVGMLALEIVNGKLLDFHPFTHFVDLRTREVV